jgi:hypothetical protein
MVCFTDCGTVVTSEAFCPLMHCSAVIPVKVKFPALWLLAELLISSGVVLYFLLTSSIMS